MRLLFIFLIIPFLSFGQVPENNLTWELDSNIIKSTGYLNGAIHPLLANSEEGKIKKDTLTQTVLCKVKIGGCMGDCSKLKIIGKRLERTLEYQKIFYTQEWTHSWRYEYIPIESVWIDNVDNCYLLFPAVDSLSTR